MHPESAVKPAPTPPDSEDAHNQDTLAEGLMLVRASTLKVIRLQLALERHDRRVALEAVDDLVALDRSLEEHLAGVPAVRDQRMLGRYLETERAALNLEKLGLTAQVIRHDSPDPSPAILQPPLPEPAEEIAAETPLLNQEWMDALIEEDPPRRTHWWVIGLALLVSCIAGGLYLLGMPDVLAWLQAQGG